MAAENPEAQNLYTTVYGRLKSQIIDLTLKPGQKLQDRQLASQLGVSRTPVREALNRLMQEDLVRQVPGQGYFVKGISIKEIEDIYETREALEVLAAKQAIENMDDEQNKKLSEILESHRRIIQKGEVKSRLIEDADFHKTIALSSKNRYLYEVINNIFDKIALLQGIDILTLKRIKVAHQEHEEIFNLLKGKQTQALVRRLKKHVSEAKTDTIERLKKKSTFLYPEYRS